MYYIMIIPNTITRYTLLCIYVVLSSRSSRYSSAVNPTPLFWPIINIKQHFDIHKYLETTLNRSLLCSTYKKGLANFQ
jgi:hypothetical protein